VQEAQEAYETVWPWDRKRAGLLFRRVSRSLLRLHLWLGTMAVAYILFVSLSGCIILFQHELYRFFPPIRSSYLQTVGG
jgi:uncharacterized iron-regulated membrane protein